MAAKPKATEEKRRVRNPEATREAILTAARTVLSEDGPEGLSVSRVANLAGVNRGTAYQHFHTREDLLHATADWVADQLLSEGVFAARDEVVSSEKTMPAKEQPVFETMERMVNFAVENPELGRIWLFEMLSSKNPSGDKFFARYKQGIESLVAGEYGHDDVDSEALAVLMLAGNFLWPVWVNAHAKTKKERTAMTKRFSREMLRLTLNGVLKPKHYPNLIKMLKDDL